MLFCAECAVQGPDIHTVYTAKLCDDFWRSQDKVCDRGGGGGTRDEAEMGWGLCILLNNSGMQKDLLGRRLFSLPTLRPIILIRIVR